MGTFQELREGHGVPAGSLDFLIPVRFHELILPAQIDDHPDLASEPFPDLLKPRRETEPVLSIPEHFVAEDHIVRFLKSPGQHFHALSKDLSFFRLSFIRIR